MYITVVGDITRWMISLDKLIQAFSFPNGIRGLASMSDVVYRLNDDGDTNCLKHPSDDAVKCFPESIIEIDYYTYTSDEFRSLVLTHAESDNLVSILKMWSV